MYYVLFHWIKGKMERDFRKFRDEKKMIDFLHEKYKEISVYTIIEPRAEYRLGLIIDERYIISTIEQKKEAAADEEKPADYLGSLGPAERTVAIEAEASREEKKHPFLKDRKEEPSAMEKIADDIEKEKKEDLPDDEIIAQNKEVLEKMGKAPTVEQTIQRGEKAIKAAELEQSRHKDWPKCPECKIRPMAPWNKKGKCSTCQQSSKGKRPYKKRKTKKEEELPF